MRDVIDTQSELSTPRPSSRGVPVKPDYLDEMASSKWDEMASLLWDAGVLSHLDGDLLAQYCQAYSGYRLALAQVQKTGLAVMHRRTDGSIDSKRSPFVTELHKFGEQCTKLLIELGITPRQRMQVVSRELDATLFEMDCCDLSGTYIEAADARD